jgi:hypothetical protein
MIFSFEEYGNTRKTITSQMIFMFNTKNWNRKQIVNFEKGLNYEESMNV